MTKTKAAKSKPRLDDKKNTLNVFILPPLPKLDLPPLPPIDDPILENMVFTHTSLRSVPRGYNTSVFLRDGEAGFDYEKLEHVGDALLESVAVTLAHELYPNFRQGSAAIMRDKLVCNLTLAQISVQYGLHEKLRCDPASRHAIKNNIKIQASVFEAYIAGIYYSFLGSYTLLPLAPSSISLDRNLPITSTTITAINNKPAVIRGDVEKKMDFGEFLQSSILDIDEGKNSKTCPTGEKEEEIICQDKFSTNKKKDTSLELQEDCYQDIATMFETIIFEEPTSAEENSTSEANRNLQRPEILILTTLDAETSDIYQTPKTRGEAYDHLFSWLQNVLKPVAEFAVEQLKIEELRIATLYPPKIIVKFDIPKEWEIEDAGSLRGKSILHDYLKDNELARPSYTGELVEGEWIESPWKVGCGVVDKNGKEWQSEAIRMTKQAASNVAAWKICVDMGIITQD